MEEAQAYVVEAELELDDGCDPAAVGAAVTVELCGHWEHPGPCRWPHNSAIAEEGSRARFRTLFVAEAGEEAAVRDRIETSLRGGDGWRVFSVRARAVETTERGLPQKLATGPRRAI